MKTNLGISMLLLPALVFAVSCGGGQPQTLKEKELAQVDDNVDPVAHLVGDVGPGHIEEDKVEQPSDSLEKVTPDVSGDVIEGHQGSFLPIIKIFGEPVKGTYTVKTATASADVVMENVPTGVETKIDPGTYDFVFTTEAVAGNPELTLREVQIHSGRRVKRDVKLKVGKITLVTGARCKKSALKIKRKGATDWMPGKFFTCKEILLMAGEYDALKGKTPISGIQVYDGGIREILIRKK